MSALARSQRRLRLGALLAGLLAAAVAFIALRAGYAQILFLLGAFLVFAASVAYLLWRANPAYTLTAGFVLTCFSGHWANAGLPTGGTIAPDRILLAGGLIAILFRGPWMKRRPPLRLEAVHWTMLAAVGYVLASALLTGSLFQQSGFFKVAEAFGIGPFLVFLLAPFAFARASNRDALLVGFVLFGAYLGVVAVLEVAGAGGLVLPKYINNPAIGIHFGRARGPFAEAVTNGTGLFCCAVGCAVAAYVWRERRRARLIAAAVGALCFMDTFITFQRSVWLAAVVATVAAGVSVRPLRRFLLPVGLVAALVVTSMMVASPTIRRKATERTNDIGTVHDRDNLNTAAINMIEARPLAGFGWEQFTNKSADYFQLDFNFPLSAAHSEVHDMYLSYGAELGLIGLVLWAAVFLLGVGGALTTRGPPAFDPWRAGLVAIAAFYLIVSAFVPPQVFPNLMLWLWVGVVWSPRATGLLHRRPRVATATAGVAPAVVAPPAPPAASAGHLAVLPPAVPVAGSAPPVAPAEPAPPAPADEEPDFTWEEPGALVLPPPVAPRGEAAGAADLSAELTGVARAGRWRGADPYDGLWHSRWPRPLTGTRRGRQAVIQLGARSPVDLRRFQRTGHPLIAKAPALFGAAATRLWLLTRREDLEDVARDALETVAADDSAGTVAWGYPFPVQTRWSFYDAGTPNVVVTSFCALALHEAGLAFGEEAWTARARAAAEWVLTDLFDDPQGIFTYHPGSGELIHNANLLGARLVRRVLPDDPRTRPAVSRALAATLRAQRADGSFPYGDGPGLGWADSFHTGYVLECLADLRDLDPAVDAAIESGASFWTGHFFGPRGQARLWPDEPWPIDGHSAGTALTTLAALADAGLDVGLLAERVAREVRRKGVRHGHGVHRRWRVGRSAVAYPRWVDGHLALGLASYAAQASRASADT